jgi:hypothetical protein
MGQKRCVADNLDDQILNPVRKRQSSLQMDRHPSAGRLDIVMLGNLAIPLEPPMQSLLAALVSLGTGLTALVAWPTGAFALNDEAHMKIELKILSGIAMQQVVEDLGPKFERATGHKLAITFANLGGAVKRVQDGETADVLVIPRSGIEGFVKDVRVAVA